MAHTPTYTVRLFVRGFVLTESIWRVRTSYIGKGNGQPNERNLAQYIKDFEDSTREGGVNAHLGYMKVLRARIRNQITGEEMAEYTAPSVQAELARVA